MKTKKVPKLRFPEFSGEWEEKKLGDLATKVGSGSTPRGGNKVYRNQGVPFIRSQNVIGGILDMHDIVFIDEDMHKSMSNSAIRPNDVLLNITGASLGRTCVVPVEFKEGNLNQHVCIIRLSEANSYLVHTILSKPKSLHELLKTQTGGGKEGLNFQAVRSFKLALPASDEQKKIAGFLGAVDNKVPALQNKVELMKKYKKGVTQKIFSQQIRFKKENGKDFSAWQEKRLGEVLYAGSKVPVSDTSIYKKLTVKLRKQGLEFTENNRKMADTRPFYVRRKGEIIIGKQNYFNGSIAIVTDEFDGCICSNAIMSFSLKPGYSTRYLFEKISSHDFLKRREALANGTGQKELSEKDFLEFTVDLPSSEEQEKIADFLTSIDEKINLTEKELEQAKLFKKALLQQMFV